eukprot:TRINITY_DN4101_c0_g1_i1.p1 TRINITY_DN4101_c0_g1~~TRINITY_DN4101_c0_g1_i1.p1  ORF type:complete len:136 (+),score=35.41 TRINITY_DN4101_c0_g1_i1:42-410(+)
MGTNKAKENSDTTSTQNPDAKIVTQNVRFEGDYDKVIGSKKAEFLRKCSELLTPLKCKDAYAGSVVVVMEGTLGVMKEKVLKLVSTGLSVPNFAPMTIAKGRRTAGYRRAKRSERRRIEEKE